MRKTKIKTIDVTALEWFDKANGNSYFAGTITVNYGMKSVRDYEMPYQYGYGEHYVEMARQLLKTEGEIKTDEYTQLWRYCEDNNIILRTAKHENCKKSELKNI